MHAHRCNRLQQTPNAAPAQLRAPRSQFFARPAPAQRRRRNHSQFCPAQAAAASGGLNGASLNGNGAGLEQPPAQKAAKLRNGLGELASIAPAHMPWLLRLAHITCAPLHAAAFPAFAMPYR